MQETLQQYRERTGFMWDSLGQYGGLRTSGGLAMKVDPDGRFKPFYGDTVIFSLPQPMIHWLEGIQDELYMACGECLAERIAPESFHKLLDAFCAFVDQGDMERASKCYMVLMNGTDDQLCRLGLQLAVGQYNKSLAYREFPYPAKKNGRSCAPVSFMRVGWETWLVVNLAAFPNGTTTLGFASDISQGLYPIAGVQYGKEATYHATGFGWLGGKREAHLLAVEPWKADEIDGNLKKMIWRESDLEKYQKIFQRIDLQPNEALFAENGEKEFSVEITWVENNTAQVLCRYTIGCPDQGKDHLAQVSDFCFL